MPELMSDKPQAPPTTRLQLAGALAMLLWVLGLALRIFYTEHILEWTSWLVAGIGVAGIGAVVVLQLRGRREREHYAGAVLCSLMPLVVMLGVQLRLSGALPEYGRAAGQPWWRDVLGVVVHPRTGVSLLLLAGLGGFWGGSLLVFRRNVLGPFVGLLMVWALFFVIAPDPFHSIYNTKTFVAQSAIIGIGALGMCLVIISGSIDLSVGSTVALSTVVTALVLRRFAVPNSATAIVAAVLAAILAGGLSGAFNGAVSAGLNIVPFIVTLGSMMIVRGVAKGLARNQTVTVGRQTWLSAVTKVTNSPNPLDLPFAVWLLLVLTVLVALVLRYTVYGRYVFALGSNESTARLCGVPVRLYRILTYTLCGMFTGLAGVVQFGRLSIGSPTAAVGMELRIIAAVVIGGGSLSGGEGSAAGCLVGALMILILGSGCNQMGLADWVQYIIIGAVIIGAVAVDRLKHWQSG